MKDRTWEFLEKHLESGAYAIFSAQDSAPTCELLLAFGAEIGCDFPEDFLAHSCGRFGGLYVEVKEELWPRPKPYDVGPFWSFLYGLHTYDIADGIPDFMDLRANTTSFRSETGSLLVPCLKVIGDADIYCFDATGRVGRWDHETNEVAYRGESFFEILDRELGELQERKMRKCNDPRLQ